MEIKQVIGWILAGLVFSGYVIGLTYIGKGEWGWLRSLINVILICISVVIFAGLVLFIVWLIAGKI